MRIVLLTTSVVLGVVVAASGQPASRFALGPLVRVDRVSVEGNASGNTPVAGVVASVRMSKIFGVEAELTQAWNPVERSYEGWFISYAQDPNATREEVERLAPTARRTLVYAPGLGGVAALVMRGGIGPRVGLAGRVGFSARQYVETSSFTVLSIPEAVDPEQVARFFQDTSRHRTRGGLLLGVDLSVAVTDHVSVVPEIRFVYGGPAQIGNTYRELGLGLRGVWRF